jgi:hypothetical protein
MKSQRSCLVALLALGLATAPVTVCSAQELVIHCTVATPAVSASPVEFGLARDAFVGVDGLDEPLPPPAPGQATQVYLQMLTPPVPLPNRWRRDVRPFFDVSANTVELWSMTVETDAVGQILTFSVDAVINDAPPYTLHVFGPGGLYRPVMPGDVIEVPCTAPITSFFWELQYDEQVATPPQTWGGLQSLYR